jgi:Lamin Tail Domain
MQQLLKLTGMISIAIIGGLMPAMAQASLQLSELMPDPAGDDSAEWIEIHNDGNVASTTAGWTLLVKTRSTSLPDKTLAPGQYLVITKAEAGFTLTNSGAAVSLVDPAGVTNSQLTYGQAPTGQSYALLKNAWQWTKTPTPAAANVLSIETTPNSPA